MKIDLSMVSKSTCAHLCQPLYKLTLVVLAMQVGLSHSTLAAGSTANQQAATEASSTTQTEHIIRQKDKAFSQSEITIKVGDKLTFTNEDNTTHHIMLKLDGKRISKKQPKGGEPISISFSKPQKTTVRCAIHPKMKLKVEVVE